MKSDDWFKYLDQSRALRKRKAEMTKGALMRARGFALIGMVASPIEGALDRLRMSYTDKLYNVTWKMPED